MLFKGSTYAIKPRGGSEKAVTTKKSPDDAGRVVWALGTHFSLFFRFFYILTNNLYYLQVLFML